MTNTVINNYNYNTILETFDYIQTINPGGTMALTFAHPIGAAANTEITMRYSKIKEYIAPSLKKYGYLINTHYIPRCILYPYYMLVTNGDNWDNGSKIKPGTDFIDDSYKETDYGAYAGCSYVENINEIKSSIYSRIKSKNCKQCKFDKECIGIWKEYGYIYPDIDIDLIPIKE